MKIFMMLALLSGTVWADRFTEEAPKVSDSLKKNLMGNLQREIKEKGTAAAIDFCHLEVKDLAARTGEEFKGKYEFGRTSHKIRNPRNAPPKWMDSYLEKFQNKKQADKETQAFYHTTTDGQRVYLEPLWVAPLCLQCHGENVSSNVKKEILKRYPEDQAQNFKVGDFRGFIWVKEK